MKAKQRRSECNKESEIRGVLRIHVCLSMSVTVGGITGDASGLREKVVNIVCVRDNC